MLFRRDWLNRKKQQDTGDIFISPEDLRKAFKFLKPGVRCPAPCNA